jgi:hypothetical protein
MAWSCCRRYRLRQKERFEHCTSQNKELKLRVQSLEKEKAAAESRG